MKKFIAVLLLLVVAILPTLAQTATPPRPQTPPPVQQKPAPSPEQQPSTAPPSNSPKAQVPEGAGQQPEPETHITPEQARQLFRSVDEILKFVSEDTGLPIKHEVKRQLASREQVQKFIQDRMKEDEDAKRLERSEIVLKKFGLVPRDFNLRTFLVELLKEQVAGFYDAKTKTVYLLDWVEPEQQKPVLAHELTHALQDQNFGLQEMAKEAKKNDPTGLEADERQAAEQAVTEGQGMVVLLDYSLAPMGASVAQQPAMVDAMEAGLTSTGPNMVMFNRAPMFLKEVLLFPYRYGTLFERDLLVAGGKQEAFTKPLKSPPKDTRQILEPKTYLEGQYVPPQKPLEFEKLAHDYKKWDMSAMGEFDVVLLMTQYANAEAAKALSPQWRGGYYWAALTPSASKQKPETPVTSDLAVAYISKWAGVDAAQQFAAAYSNSVPKRYAGASKVSGGETSSSIKDVPGTGVQVSVAPRLSTAVTWQTSEGLVSVEPRGDTVLVMESFDPATAAKIRDAAFASEAGK